jgi:pyruvyltransferase
MALLLKQFTQVPNAGDAASHFVVSRLLQTDVQVIGPGEATSENLLAIGSILHWADSKSIIWGTGFISRDAPLRARPASILAVRGHLTRLRLVEMGIECPNLVGDPGVLISDFVPPAKQRDRVGLVPHFVDMNSDFVSRAREQGLMIIDPGSPLLEYLAALTSCKQILSSSLHGLIFAHAYGIPACWVTISDKVVGQGYKFFDYYSAIGFQQNDVLQFGSATPLDRLLECCSLPKHEVDKDSLRRVLLASFAG